MIVTHLNMKAYLMTHLLYNLFWLSNNELVSMMDLNINSTKRSDEHLLIRGN